MGCCGNKLSAGVMNPHAGTCQPTQLAPTGYLAPDGVTVLVGTYRITYTRIHGSCYGTGAVLDADGFVLIPTPRMVALPPA
jgi:hypothetical protein